MKKNVRVLALVMVLLMIVPFFAACGSSADAVTGTWKQTDQVNGDWTWTFGNGKCNLVGDTTGFKSDGTYKLDESAKTLTVNLDGWTDEKVYSYTLDGDTLDLSETYSHYHLVKQK